MTDGKHRVFCDSYCYCENSIVKQNAIKDPNYAPYCMRCPGLVRMVKLEHLHWRCKCGATHDERNTMAQSDKLPYVSVYRPIAGWKAIIYWWNPELGGFWEPWDTWPFAYATKEPAIADAKSWAEAEGLEYKE